MKVIGSGLIATAFLNSNIDYKGTIFASGVSNSKEIREGSFQREADLLEHWLVKSKSIIYFSTCSVEDPYVKHSKYVQHKVAMENMVLEKPSSYVIRLPQVVGKSSNKNTVIGYLAHHIYSQIMYDLYQGAVRNLIDIDDVVILIQNLLSGGYSKGLYSFVMPVDFSIEKIVAILERVLNKKSKHNVIQGNCFHYSASLFVKMAIKKKILECDEHYLDFIIEKYYSKYPDEF
jgi:nucleoside-diphosphate-sugar epimerase